MTRSRDTANTQENVGGSVAPFVAGKNQIINGDFGVWQRGTSSLTFTNVLGWSADHWWGIVSGGTPTCTVTRQTADTTGFTYGMRFGRNSGQTSTGSVYVGQTLESTQTRPLAGKTVTISFYAKKGADAPATLGVGLYTGTGTDQGTASLWAATWTGVVNAASTVTLTTTMTRYSVSLAIGATATEVLFYLGYASTGTAGANEWVQLEGVQVEVGSTATPFTTATGTIQGELAACQRYYWRSTNGGNNGGIGIGYAYSTTAAAIQVNFPTQMRITPTVIDYSTLWVGINNVSGNTFTALAIDSNGSTPNVAYVNATGATGLTQYRPMTLQYNGSSSAYLGFSAEL